jgi:hypothetical protein
MFDMIRATPGVSPTSPGSGTATTVSAFGSGTNENQFLFDGTNFTCPCNGVARAEPGVDFIQEIQVQSVGASAEFGNVQGAVFNVVTRQGGDRFLHDSSYYAQAAGLTGQPVRLPYGADGLESGYERARYRDFTANLGGRRCATACSSRVSVSARLRQPAGHRPEFPRVYEQDKVFAKLTWRLSPAWQLVQSFNEVLAQPRTAHAGDAFRGHRPAARIRAGRDLRPPHTHAVEQHPLGPAGRPFLLLPGEHPE